MEDLEDILELNKSEGIYIEIGTKMFLEIEGVNFTVSSTFVGLLKDEFMITTLPKRFKSVENKLYPSSKMVVKYLFDGSIFAFQTSIIEILTTPIRALVIEYPKIIQQRELRGVKRKEVVIPGRIETTRLNAAIVIFDISKNGCRFKYHDERNTSASLKDGDSIRLYCHFPGHPEEAAVVAKVRNIKREKRKLIVGAQFLEVPESFIKPLMEFLYSIEDFF